MSKNLKLKEIILHFYDVAPNSTIAIGNNKVKMGYQIITLDELLKKTQEYPQIQAFLSTYFACFHMEQYLNTTTLNLPIKNPQIIQEHFQEINIDSVIPSKEKHRELLKQQVEWINQQPMIEIEDDDFQVVNLNETRKQD